MIFHGVGKIRNFSGFLRSFFVAVLLLSAVSSGEIIRWSSTALAGDTRFGNPANWSNGKVPQNGDTILFDTLPSGSAACILDVDPTINSIAFRNNYSSSFDFNGHFLSITGGFADFRSNGLIDGKNNRGGILFAGPAVQDFFPGKAHFPCIIVQCKASGKVDCREMGMLVDTLILNAGMLDCGDSLSHLCGEIRGNGGSLDFGTSGLSVFGAGVFLSKLASVNGVTGTLVCTGTGFQRVELPSDTTRIHVLVQNCDAGCLIGRQNSSCMTLDSIAIRAGTLTLGDSQCLSVGTLAASHGGLRIPNSSTFIVQKSADVSGLDTVDMNGVLGFAGDAVTFVPRADAHISTISVLRGKVTVTGTGCDADGLCLSTTSQPCTLSLGSHLTHTFRTIKAIAGGAIDFGSSTLQFTGDTLDLSRCIVTSSQPDKGALSFSGPRPQVLIPNPSSTLPSLVQNASQGTSVVKNGFSCRRLIILSGTFHLGIGLSHTVTSLLRASGGGIDFGSSTLNAAADTVDLTGATGLSPATGTLSFIGAMGTQLFLPKPNLLNPDIAKSQNGTVRILGALRAKKLWISGGTFDPGDSKCELSEFSAKGGTLITGNDSMIISGNANFSDLSDLVPGKAPIVIRASGNAPTASFSSTTHIIGHLVLSALPSLESVARIIPGRGIQRAQRVTFQWNRSADSAIFDFRQNNAGLVATDSVDVTATNSGVDKGVIFMGSGSWTFSGDVIFKNYLCDSSTAIFDRNTGRQSVNAVQPFNNVIHSGPGTLELAAPFASKNFTQTGGIFDPRGMAVAASNDFTLLNGPGSCIAVSPRPWAIRAGHVLFMTGSPDSLLTIGNTPGCTLDAASLSVRYCTLKHCVAARKGIAYNSIDSGGNSNWSFLAKPLPIRINASTVSFGSLRVGDSIDTIVTLSNVCNDTVTVFSVQRVGQAFNHALGSCKISPHASVRDTIIYSPNDAGPDFGSIIIVSNAESSPDTVHLRGTGKGPRLDFSSDTISFGSVTPSRLVARTVVFRNSGTDTMQLSLSVQQTGQIPGDSIFRVSLSKICAPQDSCVDTIRFESGSPGSFSAFLIVRTNCFVPLDTIMINALSAAVLPVDRKSVIPLEFAFQEITTIEKSVVFRYCLPSASRVSLEIYDAIGRIIERPIESVFGPSEYQYTWDASRLSRGIYFCRLRAADSGGSDSKFVKTIRVVFSK